MSLFGRLLCGLRLHAWKRAGTFQERGRLGVREKCSRCPKTRDKPMTLADVHEHYEAGYQAARDEHARMVESSRQLAKEAADRCPACCRKFILGDAACFWCGFHFDPPGLLGG